MIDPPPARILLIRPSALGDVCRTVPLVVSLKQAWPAARIDWLVQEGFEDAVRSHPGVASVVTFPRGRARRWWTPAAWRALSALAGSLRSARYDVVIDAQGLARSGALAFLSGAKIRIGPADGREGSPFAYTHRVQVDRVLAGAGEARMHTVERMLALLSALDVPVHRDLALYPPPDDAARVAADLRLADHPFMVIAPTSRWPGKRWPIERFAELAAGLLAQGDIGRIVLVGGRGEREQCGPLLSLSGRDGRVIDLIGETGVGGLMAVIARSALVVANDSAALHMAVGLGRRYVGLFGPTDVGRVGPFGGRGVVLQQRGPADTLDHKQAGPGIRMMERITVADSLRACESLLRSGAVS